MPSKAQLSIWQASRVTPEFILGGLIQTRVHLGAPFLTAELAQPVHEWR
jgi:hypothetical protein